MLLRDLVWGPCGGWSGNNHAYIQSGFTGEPGGNMIFIWKGSSHLARLSWCDGSLGRFFPDRPYLLNVLLEVDFNFLQVFEVYYHLSEEVSSGHYCAAINDQDWCWVFGGSPVLVKFLGLLRVAQENSCLLWLVCTPSGGAAAASWLADESLISITPEEVNHFIHDSDINDNWHGSGLYRLDHLDAFFLVNNPCLYQTKCITCGSWPWDIDDTFLRYLEPDGKMPVPWLKVRSELHFKSTPNEVVRPLSFLWHGSEDLSPLLEAGLDAAFDVEVPTKGPARASARLPYLLAKVQALQGSRWTTGSTRSSTEERMKEKMMMMMVMMMTMMQS